VAELREKLAQSEHSLVELGLRLSQENEALKKELAAVLQGQENIGPRMNTDEHE
jgi:hypothetical protein